MKAEGVIVTILIFVSLGKVSSGDSYIPTYIEGTPVIGSVVDNAPADLRNEPLFRIQHKVSFGFM